MRASARASNPYPNPETHAHTDFSDSFCKSQLPHRSVNLFFVITHVRNELTNLCGNRLWQNDFINTLCEIKTGPCREEGRPRLSCAGLPVTPLACVGFKIWGSGFRVVRREVVWGSGVRDTGVREYGLWCMVWGVRHRSRVQD